MVSVKRSPEGHGDLIFSPVKMNLMSEPTVKIFPSEMGLSVSVLCLMTMRTVVVKLINDAWDRAPA